MEQLRHDAVRGDTEARGWQENRKGRAGAVCLPDYVRVPQARSIGRRGGRVHTTLKGEVRFVRPGLRWRRCWHLPSLRTLESRASLWWYRGEPRHKPAGTPSSGLLFPREGTAVSQSIGHLSTAEHSGIATGVRRSSMDNLTTLVLLHTRTSEHVRLFSTKPTY